VITFFNDLWQVNGFLRVNNLHQVCTKSKDWKAKYFKLASTENMTFSKHEIHLKESI
jgi:hypothetical protein